MNILETIAEHLNNQPELNASIRVSAFTDHVEDEIWISHKNDPGIDKDALIYLEGQQLVVTIYDNCIRKGESLNIDISDPNALEFLSEILSERLDKDKQI